MMTNFLDWAVMRLYQKKAGGRMKKSLEELTSTQWLSHDELEALQQSRLQRLLEYAYQYVPYYQRTFDEVGFKPGDFRSDFTSLSKIPILTKPIIRENWNDLLTTEPERRRRLKQHSTSGSTGVPLDIMHDEDFATGDLERHLSWSGWIPGDWQAWIWGLKEITNPGMTQKIQSWLETWVQKRFKINAYSMTDQTMTAFAKKICHHKPSVLFGYTSSLHHFAQFIRKSPFQDITFKGIYSTAETLPASVRSFLEDTFRTKVFNRYGAIELGGIACECEAHTGLHVSMEKNYIEILRDGYPAEPGEIGDIVVTNLLNLGMPFIRYSIGDAGAWYRGENCPCGRGLSMMQTVEGRVADSFKSRDGRVVSGAYAFNDFNNFVHPSIKQFQVVQKSLDEIVLRLVPEGEIPQPILDELSHDIRGLLGENVIVHFEILDAIPPLPSGKHQYAVSELK